LEDKTERRSVKERREEDSHDFQPKKMLLVPQPLLQAVLLPLLQAVPPLLLLAELQRLLLAVRHLLLLDALPLNKIL
jgi:hypothetical protein